MLFESAQKWMVENSEIPDDYYCSNSAVFQSRLIKLQEELGRTTDKELGQTFPLIVAIAGEIGNNSFDHNLGNWPNVPGIFFAYDLEGKEIILADRGQGILTTLKRSRPDLTDDAEALRVAFTEIISGRAPEVRGNGLKFVKEVVRANQFYLKFQTGNASLELKQGERDLVVNKTESIFRGCLAQIKF